MLTEETKKNLAAQEIEKDEIKQSIIGKLQRYNGRTLENARPQQIYHAIASTVRDMIMEKWTVTREEQRASKDKRLYYLSIEFLLGRSLYSNILNMCSSDVFTKALTELGISWRDIVGEEPEPGLGNGGLGRLAACFMDSLSSLSLPAMGCTIRYEYGLFRQKLTGGQQVDSIRIEEANGDHATIRFKNTVEAKALSAAEMARFGAK